MDIRVSHPTGSISGSIRLDGSKSISNRALILRSLSGHKTDLFGISDAEDTRRLQKLLESDAQILDAGHAGTTFRFLTAYLTLGERSRILTGSKRMQQRPIGPLVDILNALGARITYLQNDGYPPLKIEPSEFNEQAAVVQIDSSISSQFVSAVMMIGPYLPGGLRLQMMGHTVSTPYIAMTMHLMRTFGAEVAWHDDLIEIEPIHYAPRESLHVEADWSAASYYYACCALAKEAQVELVGLHKDSTQGDAIFPQMMTQFGVETEFTERGIYLTKSAANRADRFEYDFTGCPDLGQTVLALCAAQNRHCRISGLQTLRIKETDRIAAMQFELAKIGASLIEESAGTVALSARSGWMEGPVFKTYQDHRMAMALAPLGLINPVIIQNPTVVRKSYPAFWTDLESLGFDLEEIS